MKERAVWQTSDKVLEARVCVRGTAQSFLSLG